MKKGFTLVEIMIVVAIIVLLAAIAIPNLLRARLNANESAAVAGLHTISTAAQSYRAVNPLYPSEVDSLDTTGSTPPYIDDALATPTTGKQGYIFSIRGATGSVFISTAAPVTFQTTGVRSFFVDASGVMRYTTANVTSDTLTTANTTLLE